MISPFTDELGWVVSSGPTTIDSIDGFVRRLQTLGRTGSVCVIIDRHHTALPLIASLVQLLVRHFRAHTWTANDDSEALVRAIRSSGPWSTVIGVGGGVALDVAKLTALDDRQFRTALQPGRSSRILLPERPDKVREATVALVPTTFGTGSELSSSACTTIGDRKRLISGAELSADLVLARPELLASLDDEQIAEGLVEIVLRLTTIYASGSAATFADTLIRAALRQLAQIAPRVLIGQRSIDDLRTLASLSAFSHTGWLTRDRAPVATLPWILTTELSMFWSCSKAAAAAVLLPSYWEAMALGNPRLGSSRRLAELWAYALPSAASPTEALRSLAADRVTLPTESVRTGTNADTFVRRVLQRWGAGLPYTGEANPHDIRQAVAAVFERESVAPSA